MDPEILAARGAAMHRFVSRLQVLAGHLPDTSPSSLLDELDGLVSTYPRDRHGSSSSL